MEPAEQRRRQTLQSDAGQRRITRPFPYPRVQVWSPWKPLLGGIVCVYVETMEWTLLKCNELLKQRGGKTLLGIWKQM